MVRLGKLVYIAAPETYKNGWCYSIRKTSKEDKRVAQALTFLGLCIYTFVLFNLAVILEVLVSV